jgi:hypothetical protein
LLFAQPLQYRRQLGALVNLLVRLLLEDPSLVDDLAGGDTVTFSQLVDRLPAESEAASLARPVQGDPALSLGYLQVLTAPEWEDALASAREGGSSQASEWVTMVAGSDGATGLTLPEDASPVKRLSFFSRVGLAVRRISIDAVHEGEVGVGNGHCGLPSRGTCEPGGCGGCTARLQAVEPPGIVCVCSHSR